MLPPLSEPQSTGASVALGGAALASDALLASLGLRNKSPLPLTAGVAGAKHISRFQILHEKDLETEGEDETIGCDFAAVTHANTRAAGESFPSTPLPPALSLPPNATSFPLLDDDGNIIVGHQMLPVQTSVAHVETSEEFNFPLGPLIWEPETEETSQICMEPARGIARCNSPNADAVPPLLTPSQLAREIAVPMTGTMWPRPAAVRPAPTESAPRNRTSTTTHSQAPESVGFILDSLRAEAARQGDTAASGTETGPPTDGSSLIPGRVVPHQPLSFADWMLSSQQLVAPVPSTTSGHSPDSPPGGTILPSAGGLGNTPQSLVDADRSDASPGHGGGRKAQEKPSTWTPRVAASAPVPDCQHHGPALVYHRSMAPLAPVHLTQTSERSGPLAMILAALILTVALLAMAVWGNGLRSGKESTPPPWTQDALPTKEQPTAAAAPNL